MKGLAKVLGGVVVVILVLGAGVWLYLDQIVQRAVVEVGSRVTGTTVELDGVSLSPLAGELAFNGLRVGNPEGFTAPWLFSLGSIDLALDTSSLRDEVLVINHLIIDQPQIHYQATPAGDNLSALRERLARGEQAGETRAAEAEDERRIIIETLAIRGGQIQLNHYLLADRDVQVRLPDLELRGIGQTSGGATLAEVTRRILAYLSEQATAAALNSDQVEALLEDARSRIEEQLRETLDTDSLDRVEGRIRGLLDSLGR